VSAVFAPNPTPNIEIKELMKRQKAFRLTPDEIKEIEGESLIEVS